MIIYKHTHTHTS